MPDTLPFNFTREQLVYIEEIKLDSSLTFLMHCFIFMFIMQAGFVLIECGAIKQSHHSYVVAKNLIDSLVGVLAFWMLGFGLAFGTHHQNGFMGIDYRYYCTYDFASIKEDNLWIKLLFQYCFANTSATIVSGLLIEKCRVEVYALCSFMMSLCIYPIVVHWAWNENGWLAVQGYKDFAGASVVHLLGGVVGLVGNIISSSRIRYNHGGLQFPFMKCQSRMKYLQRSDENERKQVENIADAKEVQDLIECGQLTEKDVKNLQLAILEQYDYPVFSQSKLQLIYLALGTYLLLFGWLFFNAGSLQTLFPSEKKQKIGKIVMNTLLSGVSSSLIAAIFKVPILEMRRCKGKKNCFKKYHCYDVSTFCNGLLSGLVAITAACDTVEPQIALVIGSIAGFVYSFFIKLLNSWNIDDPIEVAAVHFANGLWGMIACIFFDTTQGLMSSSHNVGEFACVQIKGLLAIMMWGAVWSLAIHGLVNACGLLKYHPLLQLLGIGAFKMGELGRRFKHELRQQVSSQTKSSTNMLVQGGSLPLRNHLSLLIEQEMNNFQSIQSVSDEEVEVDSNENAGGSYGLVHARSLKDKFYSFWRNTIRIYPPTSKHSVDPSSHRSINADLINSRDLSQKEFEQSNIELPGPNRSPDLVRERFCQNQVQSEKVLQNRGNNSLARRNQPSINFEDSFGVQENKDVLYEQTEEQYEEEKVVGAQDTRVVFFSPSIDFFGSFPQKEEEEEEEISDISIEDQSPPAPVSRD